MSLTRTRHLLAWMLLSWLLLGTAPPRSAIAQQADARMFPQTGYRIGEDSFWDYFKRRGGVRTFGYPVSNSFTLLGFKVQVFQREILQQQPDGSVTMMNILDEGLMPYTSINGSTFPAPDQEVLKRQPQVGTPDYHARALQFVKDNAPDAWQGKKVNFFQTFTNSVRFEEAFPNGIGDPGLLPGFNLEVWGLPTSQPTPDPANGGFIYLRFQRGIMHHDTATGATQGLLLADYVKAIMTLRNLPPDLALQARANRLYGQFEPLAPQAVSRPKELVASDLTGAFKRGPAVLVDPGHGGSEIGSSRQFTDGAKLVEKELNLTVAMRLVGLLKDAGVDAFPSRASDTKVNGSRDLTGDD